MRIIAGKFKNQKLISPEDQDIRPTTDRIRESLFNILSHQHWLPPFSNLKCLDGFCGTGALGFEALSRGAAHVTFIDSHVKSLKICTENQEKFDSSQEYTKLLKADLTKTLPFFGSAFDLIFLDPPYHKDFVGKAIETLRAAGAFKDKTILVLESHKNESFLAPEGLHLLVEKCYGQTKIQFYTYGAT